jgi:hypothetical protein
MGATPMHRRRAFVILHFLNTVDYPVAGWYTRCAKVTGLILSHRRSYMDDVCSLSCPTMAGTASVATMRGASRSLLRWVVVGAASAALFVLAVMQAVSVGAAAPATYDNTVCINYTTCYPTTTTTTGTTNPTTTATTTGYPPNTVITAPYFDNRYGFVQVVTDGSGNLIDVNPATGQRIFPFLPDYAIGGVIGTGFIAPNFVNGAFLPPGNTGGIVCNGLYGCPFGGGFIGNTNPAFINGNNCAFFGNCAAAFPAGGTVSGGIVYYNDNRFCTDGKVAYVPGRGYFCQNGGPLVPNNTVTTVNCGDFFANGCGIYRPFEANTTAPAAASQQATTVKAQEVTTAPAAPKAAAPVAQAAAPAAAPAANVATALNAPATQQAAPTTVKVQSVATAPATSQPTSTKDLDDHRG